MELACLPFAFFRVSCEWQYLAEHMVLDMVDMIYQMSPDHAMMSNGLSEK